MLRYYLVLGLRSLRRNPALTALMVLTLAVGVAASVATLAILHVMSADPIPRKSERLLVPLLDNGPQAGYRPGDGPLDRQLSYRDAVNLLAGGQGLRRSAIYGVGAAIEPQRPGPSPFLARGLAVGADFFAMFDVPLRLGHGWSAAADAAGADVVVLSAQLAARLYGNANPLGRRLTMLGQSFEVVGVLGAWNVVPRVHRVIGRNGAFGDEDEFFIPFRSAIRHQAANNGGSTICQREREPGFQGLLDSECTWIQFWFELAGPQQRAALQAYLDQYAAGQRQQGRLLRNSPNRLYDVMEWLDLLRVVGNDHKLSAWLAFGFLLLCLLNTVGLLLAKFSVRATEVAIRRALGASRRAIFSQFLVESGVVGLAGGLLGVLLAFGALALIGLQSRELTTVAHMDWPMLLLTVVMAVLAALLAGLLPTWRACQVAPALQLKSQ